MQIGFDEVEFLAIRPALVTFPAAQTVRYP